MSWVVGIRSSSAPPPVSDLPMKKNGTTAKAESPMHKRPMRSLVLRSFAAACFRVSSADGLLAFVFVLVFVLVIFRRYLLYRGSLVHSRMEQTPNANTAGAANPNALE